MMDNIEYIECNNLSELDSCEEGQLVRVSGHIYRYKQLTAMDGREMAFAILEDNTGICEIILFPSFLSKCESNLGQNDKKIVVEGSAHHSEKGSQIVALAISIDPNES